MKKEMIGREGETPVLTIKDDAVNQPPNQIRLKRTWKFNPETDGIKITGPSMTLPDDAISLYDLLTRWTQGLGADLVRAGIFTDDEPEHEDLDLQAFDRMDMTEKMDVMDQEKEKIRAKKDLEYLQKQAEKDAQKKAEKEGPKTDEKV